MATFSMGVLGTWQIPDNSITSAKLTFGTWEKIKDTTVTGSAVAAVTFTGLGLAAGILYKILYNVVNATAGADDIDMFYNNDTTTTNYYSQIVGSDDTVPEGDRQNTARIARLAASATSMGEILIQAIAGAAPYAIASITQGATNSPDRWSYGHTWITAADVTRIDFATPGADRIGIGSRIQIFKLSR